MSNTDNYQDAYKQYRSIENQLARTVTTAHKIANALYSKPESFSFANTNIPMFRIPSGTSFDMNEWPTAIIIQTQLSAWHEAKKSLIMLGIL